MIFISHNWKDKPIVEQFAVKLADIFGQNNIFYDSWSIQPGEGIIEKIDSGLSDTDIFLFFVSTNSLASKIVSLEWQNGLMRASKGLVRLIPIRIDNCIIPSVLMQTLYLDLYTNGLDITIRQVVEVVHGNNIFVREHSDFSNIGYERRDQANVVRIEIKALHFLEPRSHFLILTELTEDRVGMNAFCQGGRLLSFQTNIKFENNCVCNAFYYGKDVPLQPEFPWRLALFSKDLTDPKFRGILHQKTESYWAPIPQLG